MSERNTPEIKGPPITKNFRPYRSARYPAAGWITEPASDHVIARIAAKAIDIPKRSMSRGSSGLRKDE